MSRAGRGAGRIRFRRREGLLVGYLRYEPFESSYKQPFPFPVINKRIKPKKPPKRDGHEVTDSVRLKEATKHTAFKRLPPIVRTAPKTEARAKVCVCVCAFVRACVCAWVCVHV